MKMILIGLMASLMGVMSYGLTVEFVGYLGNSGTEECPVKLGPFDVGDRSGSQTQAGPYYDAERGLLYASAGSERLNAYTVDGRLAASYTIPVGYFDTYAAVLVRSGETLFFIRRAGHRRPGTIWQLPLNAPDGTAATKANCDIVGPAVLSGHANAAGEIVVSTDEKKLYVWNPVTGESRQIGDVEAVKPFPISIDWNSKGELIVTSLWKAYKYVDGKSVEEDGFPKDVVGRGVAPCNGIFHDGSWWAGAGCTVLRFNEAMEMDPGVVFSGAGTPTLAYLYRDQDIGSAGGVAHLGNDTIAVSGKYGSITIFEWNPVMRTCERLRRIGAIPETPCLALSEDGTIQVKDVAYLWSDPENAFTHTSWIHEGALYSTRLDGERAVRFYQSDRTGAGIAAGPFREVPNYRDYRSQKEFGDFSTIVGALVVGNADKAMVYPFMKDGTCFRFDVRNKARNFPVERLSDAVVTLSKPAVGEYTGAVSLEGSHCVLVAGGEIILADVDGETIVERKRLTKTVSAENRVAGDKERFAISEKTENRVTIFSAEGDVLAIVTVPSPGAVALCGSRMVVLDTENQRLVKYVLKE